MAKHDLITKDFALYVVHYFASMLTWSKKDILGEIDRAIKEATPIDAVRVVRCKDCVHQGTASCPTYYEDRMTYRDCWALDGDNDFCSYGERRDENV